VLETAVYIVDLYSVSIFVSFVILSINTVASVKRGTYSIYISYPPPHLGVKKNGLKVTGQKRDASVKSNSAIISQFFFIYLK
jgi:hypothetical protein